MIMEPPGVATVTITKEEYNTLKDDLLFLSLLESFGVDNWEGYELVQDEYDKVKETTKG